MIELQIRRRPSAIYVVTYFILWIVLFEFVLPVNNVLPKPSIVIQSFGALWDEYHLAVNYLNTTASVYLSILFAYLLLHFLSHFFDNRKSVVSDFIHSLNWFSKFLPGILIGFLLIYWFHDSLYIEFVFALLTSFFSFVIFFQKRRAHLCHEYVDAARSLGISEISIRRKVIWKSLQPEIFNHIFVLHLYIWSLVIAFEFIYGKFGIGNIFRLALQYRDLSAMFSAFLIVGITIFAGRGVIIFLKKKFAFWE